MLPHTVRPLRHRRTTHAVTPQPLTPNAPTAPTAEPWSPAGSAGSGVEQARAVLALPPVLAGESVQVLLMTDHGTYLADATVTHAAATNDGWSLAADVGQSRTTFALATTADRLDAPPGALPTGFTDCAVGDGPGPAPHRCPGCLATRDQPCRWANRARQHPDTEHAAAARHALTEGCPGCNAAPGEACRWSCLSHVDLPPGHPPTD